MKVSRVNQSLPALGGVRLEQRIDFGPRLFRIDRNIHVGLAKAAIPLRNLVLEHHVIAEGIPDHLVDDAMILMAIVALVAQDRDPGEGCRLSDSQKPLISA